MNKLIFLFLTIAIFACETGKKSTTDTEQNVKEENTNNEWIPLFDGTSTEGWRAYNGDSLPPGWTIVDNTLTFKEDLLATGNQDYEGSRDIIYGAKEFENFELYVEWKIPEGGNSGIFYHIKEGYPAPSGVAPEYQLIDDENYTKIHDITDYNLSLGYTENPSVLQPLQQTAADYAMHTADSNKVLHPTGEWNTTKILFTPEKVEHWLNGKKVLEFVPWSEDWYEKKNAGKWKNASDYGKFKKGYIGFQDHGSDLWFRNVKIRKL